MMNGFDRLYRKMAASSDPRYMQVFSNTMKCMMEDMITLRPDVAQEYLDKLEAIEWHNYLSRKEAASIVSNMTPSGGWDITEWETMMAAHDLCMEEEPYYNKWAMYVAMSMIYSDSAKTVATIAGKTMTDITSDELFKDIYLLALDKLKDKDGMFDIRAYFHV